MTQEIQVQAPADFQKRLIYFTTELLNRGWRVREAVLQGMKKTRDSYGEGVEFGITSEHMEKLIAYFEQTVEEWRARQEAGQQAVGGGVYAEVVSQDEYDERITKQ
jgi:hypothetical protein